jgi:RNA polymerase sigma-70 factor (ECF subfamily)
MLYRKYADKMYNVCLMYANDVDTASDILQESFIKVFRNLKKYKFEGSFEGWIRRIVINTALEHFRKKKRENEVVEQFDNHPQTAFDDILDRINADEIIRLVNSLPDKAAMVLKLYTIEGYKHKEIADLMDITEGTSKSQLNRARSMFKAMIDQLHA